MNDVSKKNDNDQTMNYVVVLFISQQRKCFCRVSD